MYLPVTNSREDSAYQPTSVFIFTCLLVCLFFSTYTHAKDEALQVIVNDTYISMHTGPGRGFPVFHVLEKGETITLLYSKTDWIKAITTKGIEGWIHRRFMDQTIGLNGEAVALGVPELDDFGRHTWEFGVAAGEFDNAIETIGLHGGIRFTKHLSVEARLSQATGRFSNSKIWMLGLAHHPFPEWRVSPFFILGNGKVDVTANTSSTQDDINDYFFLVGVGLNTYVTHRYMVRFEYNNYTTLADDDKNGNIDEWKLGFTAFF